MGEKAGESRAWNIHLLRGSVIPDTEIETARHVIHSVLRRSRVDCRKSEIDISVFGSQIRAAFIFERGTPGMLVFSTGKESWSAAE